jgi:Thioredoxin like C-terminal domain
VLLTALDAAPAPDWRNSPPLTAEALRARGGAVLVQFWTYSCVNWLRTLPYVRAWHERYAASGLTVIGAHAPEFSFEHSGANVDFALATLDVPFPVVIDNDFALWRAFNNNYWPALYLLDATTGATKYTHFGEESYAETEAAVQSALGVSAPPSEITATGLSLAADWAYVRSPETYLGTARGERRIDADEASAGGSERTAPPVNTWSLSGHWTLLPESAHLREPGGTITYTFSARDVNLVLTADSVPIPFMVSLDGAPPGADAGLDVDPSGAGVLTEPRMHQLLRLREPGEHTISITFTQAGARAYVLTFG